MEKEKSYDSSRLHTVHSHSGSMGQGPGHGHASRGGLDVHGAPRVAAAGAPTVATGS
jgi:hypothetical protein